MNLDGIAALATPGVFGHIRGYLGVVEPQMRKALHLHMLIQLVGFAHPKDLLHSGVLQDTFKRLWYFVASIYFRSSEGFASQLQEPSATQRLRPWAADLSPRVPGVPYA